METVLFVAVLLTTVEHPTATDYLARAYVKHMKIDDTLDRYQRDLFTEAQRRRLGDVALATKIVVERRITLRWEFP